MRTEKKRSNSVTHFAAALLEGILTWSVYGAGTEQKFDVRAWVNPSAYDGLTDNGKYAILHGIEQKLRDRAAIEKDTKSGKSASPTEKFDAIMALQTHLLNGGEWNMKGGGPRPLDRASLYVAVATVRNRKAEDVEVLYRDKPDEVLRTLLMVPAIAGEYAKLTSKGESDAAKALLAELEAADEEVDENEGGDTGEDPDPIVEEPTGT